MRIRQMTALLAVGLLVAGCGRGGGGTSAGTEDDPITIGVVNAAEPYWQTFIDLAAADGISVELQNFSDYQLPNQALADGQLDLNQFQHLQFLAQFNVNAGTDLVPIGATAVYPLGLYSLRHSSLDSIPDGGQVAIPNDPTNQARALLVLKAAGLVALTGGGNSFSTTADIDQDASTVTVTAVDAAQTAIALQDVDAAIINNDFVGQAGLTLSDALYADDPSSPDAEPYINIFVARAADADNETFARLVNIYHDPSVTDGVIESSGGTGVIMDNSPADLQRILAYIEDNFRQAS
ncbi:MAG: methionine ABC transporter substrate-binding protein [Cellulomonadaceae bacterium]|jgi:D-methionine transport system substrate-binding protein|nr:methionine ABC transporter substrate-binding protein [Cellulomonadaceae bacterium]